MDSKQMKELRGRAQKVKATVHISDVEVRDSIVEELKSQLKNRKLVNRGGCFPP